MCTHYWQIFLTNKKYAKFTVLFSLNSFFLALFKIKKTCLFCLMRLSGQIDYSGQPYFSCGRRFFQSFLGISQRRRFLGVWTSPIFSRFHQSSTEPSWTVPEKIDNFGRAQLSSNLGTQFLCFLQLCFKKIPSGHDCGFFLPSWPLPFLIKFVCKSITNPNIGLSHSQ